MYVAVRDQMLRWAGFGSIVEGCKAVGVEAFELAVDHDMQANALDKWEPLVKLGSAQEISNYKGQLNQQHLRVSALLLANDFSRPDLDAEIAWVVRCAELAAALGAPALRIDAIMHTAGDSWPLEKRIQVFIDSMKRVIKATEKLPVEFGIENHGAIGNGPKFLKEIITAVGSPRLGNTLDTANFYWSGKPLSEVYAIIQQFAPTTKHTHMKNIAFPAEERERQRELGWGYDKYCCGVYEGDIEMGKVVGWLREAGYKHDLCIENEALQRYPEAERQQMLKREVELLKGLL